MSVILNKKGSFMIEAVLSFMLFLLIFTGILEVFSLVESKLYVEKISREVCHEAAITSVDEANLIKDMFKLQYFNEQERPYVIIDNLAVKNNYICCRVVYYHPAFKYIFPEGKGRLEVSATTIFPRDTRHK